MGREPFAAAEPAAIACHCVRPRRVWYMAGDPDANLFMSKLLPRVLVILGIAVNVVFLFINLRPERPHLAKLRHAKVLLRADPWRAKWIEENELKDFAAVNHIELELVTAASFEEVISLLEAEKAHPTGLVLASIDDEIAEELRKAGALRPIGAAVPQEEVAAAIAEYTPEAMLPARIDDQTWYLPRRAEVDIAAYLSPAVEEAFLHWDEDRDGITAALIEANGVGLPKGYALKKSPNDWDAYDLFVAGWYWAHHPAAWASPRNSIAPRIALRTGDGEDAVRDLISSFYAHGLKSADLAKKDDPAVLDALQWEALLRRHHLLAAACEDPKGIDSDGVNALFKARQLAWAPINQEDSLWVHGGSQRDAEPGMSDPQEIGWSVRPRGSSLELAEGAPRRPGRSFSFTKEQLWAVPVHASDPKLAFELAHFLTQRGLQQRETEAQGLLPIRRDLRADYPIVFRLAWMQRLLDASYRQVTRGSGSVPPALAYAELDVMYAALRARVVYGRPITAPVTLTAITEAVHEVPHGK
ncbi:MAG: extracellular solute-binding protein [Polyangia bacterium]